MSRDPLHAGGVFRHSVGACGAEKPPFSFLAHPSALLAPPLEKRERVREPVCALGNGKFSSRWGALLSLDAHHCAASTNAESTMSALFCRPRALVDSHRRYKRSVDMSA